MSVFKACDIRGIFGDELTGGLVERIGRSLGRMMRARGETHICVGGDFRRSTPVLKDSLVAGLVAAGVHVGDVGLLPTPVVHFAARHFGWLSAAVVTASHNPGRYNGIKFVIGGWPAMPELIEELEQGLDSPADDATAGNFQQRDILPDYRRQVVAAAAQLCPGPARPLRVVLDTMSGAFTHIAPPILESAGYRVVPLCRDIDPDFAAGEPNPAHDGHLERLTQQVTRTGSDLGIAFDGDGDRVIFVDHTGRIVRPEQVGAVLTQQCFRRPTVIYDQKCASVLPRAVEAAGGTAVMRPSGYGFIKTTMIERRAEMGIEASGHHFFAALDGGDDGLFTALVVLDLLSRTGARLAQLIEPIGWPAITPDLRIPFDGDAAAAIEQIADRCGGRVSRLDGVRADYDDGWALARPSITEPAITLRCEGRDHDCLRAILQRFLAGAPHLCQQALERIHD